MNPLPSLVAVLTAAGIAPAAQAEWSGHLELRSDQIERGVSQSDHRAGVSAAIGWAHQSGLYGSLGIASVSDEQYAGSAGYKLMPEVGWQQTLAPDWSAGVLLRGQVFPGARGSWYGSLPPRLQSRTLQPAESDFGTAELGLSLGWRAFTLSWSRSLTDYLGVSAIETEGSGQNLRQTLLESTGTRYLALDAAWPVGERWTLSAGVGHLKVPHFETLDYTDWRIGLGLATGALLWGLQASGSDAGSDAYRSTSRSGERSNAASTVSASLRWSF